MIHMCHFPQWSSCRTLCLGSRHHDSWSFRSSEVGQSHPRDPEGRRRNHSVWNLNATAIHNYTVIYCIFHCFWSCPDSFSNIMSSNSLVSHIPETQRKTVVSSNQLASRPGDDLCKQIHWWSLGHDGWLFGHQRPTVGAEAGVTMESLFTWLKGFVMTWWFV